MDEQEELRKQARSVDPAATAETLVETLSDLAAKARAVAEGLEGENEEFVLYLARVADECAGIAAIANMQREELETKLAEQKILIAQLGDYFKKMEIRSEKMGDDHARIRPGI